MHRAFPAVHSSVALIFSCPWLSAIFLWQTKKSSHSALTRTIWEEFHSLGSSINLPSTMKLPLPSQNFFSSLISNLQKQSGNFYIPLLCISGFLSSVVGIDIIVKTSWNWYSFCASVAPFPPRINSGCVFVPGLLSSQQCHRCEIRRYAGRSLRFHRRRKVH